MKWGFDQKCFLRQSSHEGDEEVRNMATHYTTQTNDMHSFVHFVDLCCIIISQCTVQKQNMNDRSCYFRNVGDADVFF